MLLLEGMCMRGVGSRDLIALSLLIVIVASLFQFRSKLSPVEDAGAEVRPSATEARISSLALTVTTGGVCMRVDIQPHEKRGRVRWRVEQLSPVHVRVGEGETGVSFDDLCKSARAALRTLPGWPECQVLSPTGLTYAIHARVEGGPGTIVVAAASEMNSRGFEQFSTLVSALLCTTSKHSQGIIRNRLSGHGDIADLDERVGPAIIGCPVQPVLPIPLEHVRAADVAARIKQRYPHARVSTQEEQNFVVVSGPASELRSIKVFAQSLDRPPR